jgi:phospholipase/carboxylesterase
VFPGDRETEFRQRALELGGFLEALAAKEPLAAPPVIAGFSQGGMTAFLVAARAPELVSGAIPMGGNLPVTLVPAALAPAVPVRALHGAADLRVPVATAQETVAAFVARGGDASLETFPDVGHTISPEMRARLWTLTATLTGPTP